MPLNKQEEIMKDVFKHHQNKIKRQDKKYSLMEYFLSDKPLEDCSEECQKAIQELNRRKQ
jgi:hypothetical protein